MLLWWHRVAVVVVALSCLVGQGASQVVEMSVPTTSVIQGSELNSLQVTFTARTAGGDPDSASLTASVMATQLFEDGTSATGTKDVFLFQGSRVIQITDTFNTNNLFNNLKRTQTVTLTITSIVESGVPESSFSPGDDIVVNVYPDETTQIVIAFDATVLTVGEMATYTLEAFDSDSNPTTSGPNAYSETVSVTIMGDASGASSFEVADGAGTGTVTSTVASISIVSFSGFASGILISGGSADVRFNAGPTATVSLEASESLVSEGDMVDITATAVDEYDNVVTSESRDISLVSEGTSVTGLGVLSFSSGVATRTISTDVAQSVTVELMAGNDDVTGVDLSDTVSVLFEVVCDGVTEYQDQSGQTSCKTVSDECDAGTFEDEGPTPSSDRSCSACNGITQYQDQTGQSSCKTVADPCTAGEYQSTSPTATNNRECMDCDGVTEYQNQANQMTCKTVRMCDAGQQVSQDPTPSTNRVCENCPVGFHDEDMDGSSDCVACSGSVVMTADFGDAGTVVFMSDGETASTTMDIDVSLASAAARLLVLTNSAQDGCTSAVYNPTDVDGSSCSPTMTATCPIGDLSARADFDLAGAMMMVSGTGIAISGVPLLGMHSIEGRAIVFLDASDNVLACAQVNATSGLTYQDMEGSSTCLSASFCEVGEFESLPVTLSSDRDCSACNGNTLYQDAARERFCRPVTDCDTGYEESVPPTASTDRECVIVTCTGFAAPEHGSITACGGEREYNTFCNVTCDATFVLQGDANRRCMADGSFSGMSASCVCPQDTFYDSVSETCVSECPMETYGVDGACVACTPMCEDGATFESQACSQVNNTDRVCSACAVCPFGTFRTGGCADGEDTICGMFQECEEGEYISFLGNATRNRECDTCTVCNATSYASTGCCDTHDTLCLPLTVCGMGQFEKEPPSDADQGGFGSDRICQAVRECLENEYESAEPTETTDRECSPCTRCVNGTVTESACTATSDTVCAAAASCEEGEFLAREPSAHNQTLCLSCTTCSSLEYATGGCNATVLGEDTVCELLTVCDPVSEYEVTAPSETTDRVCAMCSACEEGEFVTAPCTGTSDTMCSETEPEDMVCPRGQTLIGTPPDAICYACNDCPAGMWAQYGPSCPGGFTQPQCVAATDCVAGQYIAQEVTPLSDRVCKTCTPCAQGTYRASGCNGTMDSVCEPVTTCSANEFEVTPPGANSDRVCQECSVCSMDEYALAECTAAYDAICTQKQQCSTLERITRSGSATTDRVCSFCFGIRVGTVADRSECPPFGDSFCVDMTTTTTMAPTTTMPGPTTTTTTTTTTTRALFTYVEFLIDGDYDAIADLAAFKSLVRMELLGHLSLTNSSNLYALSISRGSILINFKLRDDPADMHEVTGATLFNIANTGSFAVTYNNMTYSAVAGSASYQQGGASTSSSSMTPAIIAGSVVGGIVFLALLVLLLRCMVARGMCCKSKPKKAVSKDPFEEEETINLDNMSPYDEQPLEENGYLNVDANGKQGEGDDFDEVPALEEKTALALETTRDAEQEVLVAQGEVFSSQLSKENEKLQRELEEMKSKLLQKNSVKRSPTLPESVQVDTALASRLTASNKALAKDIKKLKTQLKKQKGKVEKAAAKNIKLKMERAALLDELSAVEKVSQVRDSASKVLHERRLQEQREQEMAEKEREKQRIQNEIKEMQRRLSTLE